MATKPTDPSLREQLFGNIGPYWSAQNAEFEASNPSFAQRVGRQLNPMTGFGSNLGQLHDALGQGNFGDAAAAAALSLPGFAAVRSVATPAAGVVKSAVQSLPSLRGTLAPMVGTAIAGAAYDEANAEPLPKRPTITGPR